MSLLEIVLACVIVALFVVPSLHPFAKALFQTIVAHIVSLVQIVFSHVGGAAGVAPPPAEPMLRTPAKSTGDPSEPK